MDVAKAEDISLVVPDSPDVRVAVGDRTYGYEGLALPPRSAYPLVERDADFESSSRDAALAPAANPHALPAKQARYDWEEA